MANLIITIISIALVAVAAIMGAYYGGVAFQQGSLKADVNTLISQAEQIAAAWRLRMLSRNGNWELETAYAGIGALFLTNEFATNRPVPPRTLSSDVWSATQLNNITITSGTTVNGIRTQLSTNKVEGCNMIAQRVGGPSAVPVQGTGSDVTLPNGNTFNCVWFDDDLSTTLTSGDRAFFVYKVR